MFSHTTRSGDTGAHIDHHRADTVCACQIPFRLRQGWGAGSRCNSTEVESCPPERQMGPKRRGGLNLSC